MPDDTGPADTDPDEQGDDVDEHSRLDEVIDELREMPVGLRDPNIIGDAGPTDIPPGSDPHEADELSDEPPDDA